MPNISAMDYFQTLSSEMVEKIMSHGSERDILNMAATSKRFNEVLLASGKLLKKIYFSTRVKHQGKFAEIPERIKSRNYRKVEVWGMRQANDMICSNEEDSSTFWTIKFHRGLLALNLETLVFDNCTITNLNFAVMMRTLLPTIRCMDLVKVKIIKTRKVSSKQEVSSTSNLQRLHIIDSTPEIMSYFKNCSNLVRFTYSTKTITSKEFMQTKARIISLLSRQLKLRMLQLDFSYDNYTTMDLTEKSWNFHLEELLLSNAAKWIGLNDFLKKQESIKYLTICHSYSYDDPGPHLMRLMQTISQMKNLKQLGMDLSVALLINTVENRYVEKVVLYPQLCVHGNILKMFSNLKSVQIGHPKNKDSTRGLIQLFGFPHTLLDKIEFAEVLPIKLLYLSYEVLNDSIDFERDLMRFFEKHSERITSVSIIRNRNQSNATSVTLSFEFCESLTKLRNLNELKLYPVCDRFLVYELFEKNFEKEIFEKFLIC